MIKHPTKAHKNIRLDSPLGHLGVPPDGIHIRGSAVIIITDYNNVHSLINEALRCGKENYPPPQ